MADLLGLAANFIDNGIYDGPGSVNRVTTELSEVADGIAMVEAFSHVVSFRTDDGLVLFDTSLMDFAEQVLKSLRGWSDQRIHSVAYTHGHVDHVGGMGRILRDAADRGEPRPNVVGHENVSPRFDRYELTNGYNSIINMRQFAPAQALVGGMAGRGGEGPPRFGPANFVHPDVKFRDRMALKVGETEFVLHHDRGETDDHLWAWVPAHKAICAGDFVLWVFPNAGNPQKVQRYPREWAKALRQMMAYEPELLLPAHGLPIGGKDRIQTVLGDMATALETLLEQTLTMMNEGARLNDIVHDVHLPQSLLDKPYLRPVYDEPEFVVNNIWRLYGGWYNGNPAALKPAKDSALAQELADLAGGVEALFKRAQALSDRKEFRLACHLAEMAVLAAPDHREAHAVRAAVYGARRADELSLMSKGIYGWAETESAAKAGINEDPNAAS